MHVTTGDQVWATHGAIFLDLIHLGIFIDFITEFSSQSADTFLFWALQPVLQPVSLCRFFSCVSVTFCEFLFLFYFIFFFATSKSAEKSCLPVPKNRNIFVIKISGSTVYELPMNERAQ